MSENEAQLSDFSSVTAGTLYVVATPIGNLQDMSFRAVAVLRHVELILCEDTRHFGRLAQSYNIQTPKKSYHEHNEREVTESLIAELRAGKSVALVSDAGTPLISDPGYRIVSAAREASVPVRAVPGACAAITALSICGFEIDRFFFQGFLPQKPGKRRKVLAQLLDQEVSSVFYESPHRIIKSIRDIAGICPDRALCVARELTKVHEEVLHGTAEELAKTLESRPKILGEFVVIIRRSDGEEQLTADEEED